VIDRRTFIKTAATATGWLLGAPILLKAGATARPGPNDKIQIGQIGAGRIAIEHDLPETIKHLDLCRVMAVADVDSKRAVAGKRWIESYYERQLGKTGYVDVKVYGDYRQMLKDPAIDAVIISTPDHWHAQPAIEAALAGKDIYLQKPISLTIAEGRQVSNVVQPTGRIFQIGCQQRSVSPWPQFHRACELVRNGRIGQVKHIKIGLPADPPGTEEPEMPIPANLDYDMWLGSTPYVYYTEKRVHPQNDYSRPGWLRCEQFGAGMITGWGSHHVDIAHWALDMEYTGPVEVEAQAEFPKSGIWDVHGKFRVFARYPNGLTMEICDQLPNGIRFEGTEGWIFVARGSPVTSSDPGSGNPSPRSLDASDPRILDSTIGPNEILLYRSPEQHLNWLQCIRTRNQTIGPVEVAHRSCTACLVFHIAMKLQRKLRWDPNKERFTDDDQANTMLSRPQRRPYGTQYLDI